MENQIPEPSFNMPRINEPAPAFEARTTHGVKKLEDYRGKWLVLFSHPADFTPVCTTEFMAFAKHYRRVPGAQLRAARAVHRQLLLRTSPGCATSRRNSASRSRSRSSRTCR